MSAQTSDRSADDAELGTGDGNDDYNRVFETLVEYETDLVGMIAYARYKAAKQSWLRRRKAHDGARPKENDY